MMGSDDLISAKKRELPVLFCDKMKYNKAGTTQTAAHLAVMVIVTWQHLAMIYWTSTFPQWSSHIFMATVK